MMWDFLYIKLSKLTVITAFGYANRNLETETEGVNNPPGQITGGSRTILGYFVLF